VSGAGRAHKKGQFSLDSQLFRSKIPPKKW
jgi:hypothetical protein